MYFKREISVLIPAHNEEKTIANVIINLSNTFSIFVSEGKLAKFEIIVLDDGSTDLTYNIAKNIEKDITSIRLIKNAEPTGILCAFHKLYLEASLDWSLLIPADDQWPIEDIGKFVLNFLERDQLVPSLYVRKNKREIYSIKRNIVSKFYSTIASLMCLNYDIDAGSIKIVPTTISNITFRLGIYEEIERLILAQWITRARIQKTYYSWELRKYGEESGLSMSLIKSATRNFPRLFWEYILLRKKNQKRVRKTLGE